jgi:uncharacterized protein YjiS (DUF1127 family)
MHTHTLPRPATPIGRPAMPPGAASFIACLRVALDRWLERQRLARAYRRDLAVLAAMGERELADFGAPAWLRADVACYRSLARTGS